MFSLKQGIITFYKHLKKAGWELERPPVVNYFHWCGWEFPVFKTVSCFTNMSVTLRKVFLQCDVNGRLFSCLHPDEAWRRYCVSFWCFCEGLHHFAPTEMFHSWLIRGGGSFVLFFFFFNLRILLLSLAVAVLCKLPFTCWDNIEKLYKGYKNETFLLLLR